MSFPKFEAVLIQADAVLACKEIANGAYVIGRDPRSDIPIETPLVSWHHAQIVVEGQTLLVRDLGSSHGTYIGDERIDGTVEIAVGQAVQLGDAILTVRCDAQVTADPLREAVRYEVGTQIAKGGMGAILTARQSAIQREVAMKVMLGNWTPEDRRRFIAEAQITGRLEHPNIVPVHELGIDDNGQPYYTMKMVRGITLKDVLDSIREGDVGVAKKYSLPVLITVFQKVCDAMAFAHGHQVIHRDLKPANIMLGDYGEVLVMDWGLAKTLKAHPIDSASNLRTITEPEPDAFAQHTMAGTILGTPAYMSPEQAGGNVGGLDARSDIYALGGILFHILHLRPPYSGRHAVQIVSKVADGAIEWDGSNSGSQEANIVQAPRRGHLPEGRIPESLLAVVRRSMAFERENRYASVEEFQADVAAYQNGFATRAENAGFGRQAWLAVKRHKGVATSVAASLILLAGISIGFTARIVEERNRAISERERAEAESARALEALEETERARSDAHEALQIAEGQKRRAESALSVAEEQRQRATDALAKVETERARADNQQTRAEKERQAALAAQNRASAEAMRAQSAMETVKMESTRAEHALAELKKSAEDIFASANSLLEGGQVTEALAKTEQAVQIDGTNADYQLLRANLLQATERLERAAGAYRAVLQLRPSDPIAQANLDICESLLRENGSGPSLRPELRQALLAALQKQKRFKETGPVEAAIGGPAIAAARAALRTSLQPFVEQPEWSEDRIAAQPDGTFFLNLGGLRVETVRGLEGQPVSAISLVRSKLSATSDLDRIASLKRLIVDHVGFIKIGFAGLALEDLSIVKGDSPHSATIPNLTSLAGSPLKRFALVDVHIAALGSPSSTTVRARERVWEPLASAPLTHLTLQGMPLLPELPGVLGMSLEYLNIRGTGISDLAPLRNCESLRTLDISKTKVRSVGALSKLRLETLIASGCSINNISAIARLPLKRLYLDGTFISEKLDTIAQFAELEELTLPFHAIHRYRTGRYYSQEIAAIRRLPQLRYISLGERNGSGRPNKTAQEFWSEVDAIKPRRPVD